MNGGVRSLLAFWMGGACAPAAVVANPIIGAGWDTLAASVSGVQRQAASVAGVQQQGAVH